MEMVNICIAASKFHGTFHWSCSATPWVAAFQTDAVGEYLLSHLDLPEDRPKIHCQMDQMDQMDQMENVHGQMENLYPQMAIDVFGFLGPE